MKHILKIKKPIEIVVEDPSPSQPTPEIRHLREIINRPHIESSVIQQGNDLSTRQKIVDDAIEAGWNKGAVVVPMYTGGKAGGKYLSINWGTIIGHKRFFDEKNETFFHPLKVKWWKDNSETYEHPKELLLVNPAPEEGELQERIVRQYNARNI